MRRRTCSLVTRGSISKVGGCDARRMPAVSTRGSVSVLGLSRALDGERLGGGVRVSGTALELPVDVVATPIAGGGWLLSSQAWPRSKRVRVVHANPRVWVLVDGHAFECHIEEAAVRRATSHAADDTLRAPMPATVIRVAVVVGQAVAKDAVLVVLEAMKMELAIKAPHAGVVTRLACIPGQLVGPDDVLVALETVK